MGAVKKLRLLRFSYFDADPDPSVEFQIAPNPPDK